MSIDAITTATTTATAFESASTAPPPDDLPSNELDKDAFLKLLVAQLKYQDPTAPTDVSQMMSQTSQLTMVEQLDEIAAGIAAMGSGGPISSAASMLGKEISFDIGSFEPLTAVVEAVRIVDGETILSAGGYDVPLGSLVEIRTVPDSTTTGGTFDRDTGTTGADGGSDSGGADVGETFVGDGTTSGTDLPAGFVGRDH
ncbi:MAG: flagellar hook capping FlgD N-terminal domain-containing protein [Actinomycetota bacterium]